MNYWIDLTTDMIFTRLKCQLRKNRDQEGFKGSHLVLSLHLLSLLHYGGPQPLLFFSRLPLSLSFPLPSRTSCLPPGLPCVVSFQLCPFYSILDSLCCSLWIIPLCSLSLCQFNHFSHFKMTIPQFYRSSCLSLPVSTLTATPSRAPPPPFANVWPLMTHPNMHIMSHQTTQAFHHGTLFTAWDMYLTT